MAAENVFMALVSKHDKKDIQRIVNNGIKDYAKLLENIASDIYDSCIQDYYAKYSPTVYTRHGNSAGFNLYRANAIELTGSMLEINFDEGNLLEYGTSDDIRATVLNNVMNGIRGTKVRTKTRRKWPMEWRTSYPNNFSMYRSTWSSSASTIDSIFDDFVANVLADTYDVLWDFISKYI